MVTGKKENVDVLSFRFVEKLNKCMGNSRRKFDTEATLCCHGSVGFEEFREITTHLYRVGILKLSYPDSCLSKPSVTDLRS